MKKCAVSKGIHYEHCLSSDIPYFPEAETDSYLKTLWHQDEHPVMQTFVVLCHLSNSDALEADHWLQGDFVLPAPCSDAIWECRVVWTND